MLLSRRVWDGLEPREHLSSGSLGGAFSVADPSTLAGGNEMGNELLALCLGCPRCCHRTWGTCWDNTSTLQGA